MYRSAGLPSGFASGGPGKPCGQLSSAPHSVVDSSVAVLAQAAALLQSAALTEREFNALKACLLAPVLTQDSRPLGPAQPQRLSLMLLTTWSVCVGKRRQRAAADTRSASHEASFAERGCLSGVRPRPCSDPVRPRLLTESRDNHNRRHCHLRSFPVKELSGANNPPHNLASVFLAPPSPHVQC